MRERAIVHLNVIGFKAAVAVAKDKSLRGLAGGDPLPWTVREKR
jgi:hypothetical protein